MTDREKEQIVETLINFHSTCEAYGTNDDFLEGITACISMIKMLKTTWQPTGRACFDKPAGTPILHGETI